MLIPTPVDSDTTHSVVHGGHEEGLSRRTSMITVTAFSFLIRGTSILLRSTYMYM